MKKNNVISFSPMATIKAYLAGRQLGRREWRVVRLALTNLLLIAWISKYPELPKLAISGNIQLFDLPYLSDGEKIELALWVMRRHGYSSPEFFVEQEEPTFRFQYYNREEDQSVQGVKRARQILVLDIDRLFRKWLKSEFPYNELPTGRGPSAFLHVYMAPDPPMLPYDFRSLRVCTLLYRPFMEWIPEEHAIMREEGIRFVSKGVKQKFYHASW